MRSDHRYGRDVGIYDRLAGGYEDMRIQSVRSTVHLGLLDWIAGSNAEPPKRILDVGCGTGAMLRRIAWLFPSAELFGVDPAPGMVAEARRRTAEDFGITYVQGTAEELPYDDGHFDLVVSTLCFHHWRSRTEGLSEVSRVLRPGARFGLADHFAIGWLRPTFTLLRSRDRVLRPSELEPVMTQAGLTVDGWRLLYRLGPLPYIHGVLTRRA
ncbi:class I SAM-dependent methyltransferase [Micromonospora sp. Llam7]|uniref:class I SAM-dependent methyltransferase n=1 Tax=Micromonospora tarapacensis TaxID=2835305 RepID=UPI001C83941A|nr:class I SAM-dependent methyltransferase [Micromonospora tarapacensis]MBX7268169.1 class I SAM-dependent methyltransferase [Micromonospora tarapacensis]